MRLSEPMKDKIVNAAVHAAFAKHDAELERDLRKFGDEAYETFFDKKTIAQMARLKDPFVRRSDGFYVSHYEKPDSERPTDWHIKTTKPRPVPAITVHYQRQLEVKLPAPLKAKYDAWSVRFEANKQAKSELRDITRRMLTPMSSTKALFAAWPTVREIMPKDFFAEPVRQLPVVQVNKIQAMIDAGKPVPVAA